MQLKVQCSHCHKHFTAPETAAGKTFPCPACGASISVPGLESGQKPGNLLDELTDDELTDGDPLADVAARRSAKRVEPGTPQPVQETRPVSRVLEAFDDTPSTRRDFSGVGSVLLKIFVTVLVGLAILAFVAMTSPQARAGASGLLIAAGACAALAGGLWCVIIPFQEDVLWGLACLFIPVVWLYYAVTRIAVTWRPLALEYGGLVVVVIGLKLMTQTRPELPGVSVPDLSRNQGTANDDRLRVASPDRNTQRQTDYRKVPVPSFPVRGPLESLGSGVQHARVVLEPRPGQPGQAGVLDLYLPEGEHARRSLPCVFIAAAGGTAFSGMRLGSGDRPEHMPYALAGFAVVAYEVDGLLEDDAPTEIEMRRAYREFRDASAGLVNARNALKYTLARMPEVDPKRLYLAGHSSAGTLALLVASFESSFQGVVAYASVTDNAADVASHAAVFDRIMPGSVDFVNKFSPHERVRQIRCPVFLFHAVADPVVPVNQTKRFADLLRQRGSPVTVELVSGGDHYESMISAGIPAAISWLEQIDESLRPTAVAHRETEPRSSHAGSSIPSESEMASRSEPPDDTTAVTPRGPGSTVNRSPDAHPSDSAGDDVPRQLAGPEYDKASRDFLRSDLIDLIAGDDEVLKKRLGWVPILKRPVTGLRWGLGVYVAGTQAQPQVETAEQLAHWTGVIGPALVAQLQQRIADGDFGKWPERGDPRFRLVAPLGGGNFATLRDAALDKGLDAFLMLTVTRRISPGSKKVIVFVRCRVADVHDRVDPWTSKSINSSEVMAADTSQINPIEDFISQILTHIDENFHLRGLPDISPELARKRADSLAELADLSLLQKLIELRYYHAEGLLPDDDAIAVGDRLLESQKGANILLGDESQRRIVLQDADRPQSDSSD